MSNNFKFQASPKLGDTLVNVQGDTAEEFDTNLRWVYDNAAKVVGMVKALQDAYTAVYAVAPLAGNVASTQVQQQPAQPQQSVAPAPTCQHGAMTYKAAGVSKASGKSYSAFWACPAPRGQQCKSVDA